MNRIIVSLLFLFVLLGSVCLFSEEEKGLEAQLMQLLTLDGKAFTAQRALLVAEWKDKQDVLMERAKGLDDKWFATHVYLDEGAANVAWKSSMRHQGQTPFGIIDGIVVLKVKEVSMIEYDNAKAQGDLIRVNPPHNCNASGYSETITIYEGNKEK